MAYFPSTGSVVGFQSDPTKLLTHSSVSGSLNIVGNPSISGTVQVGNFPTNQNVSGSVVSFINGTVPVNAAGSVVAFQGTSPWVVNFQNSSIVTQVGTRTTSLVSTVPSSVIVGASIFGQLPAGTAPIGSVATLQGTNPWVVSGNVNASGSVVAFQGTSPWVVNFQNSSILATPVGSTITIQQANSIVGTYAEDAAHATADKGVFTLGVRNDAVASFTSANLDYGPTATDSAGRGLIKPFAAEEARVEGYISLTSTSVTTLVAAAGAGLRNYITDVIIANTGAATTLVTFKDGAGSVLGYTIAPTTGGSNIVGMQTPIRTGANATFDVQAATATSTLYATVKGFKAP